VDRKSRTVHSLVTTPANVRDSGIRKNSGSALKVLGLRPPEKYQILAEAAGKEATEAITGLS